MDLCGDCRECIKACKYGTFKKQGEEYLWNYKKCKFYNTVKKTIDTTYGPCNGDCINVCPIGDKGVESSEVSYDKSMTETLDEIMEEIKPYYENSQDNEYWLTKIHEIFENPLLAEVVLELRFPTRLKIPSYIPDFQEDILSEIPNFFSNTSCNFGNSDKISS